MNTTAADTQSQSLAQGSHKNLTTSQEYEDKIEELRNNYNNLLIVSNECLEKLRISEKDMILNSISLIESYDSLVGDGTKDEKKNTLQKGAAVDLIRKNKNKYSESKMRWETDKSNYYMGMSNVYDAYKKFKTLENQYLLILVNSYKKTILDLQQKYNIPTTTESGKENNLQ
jgi:hypothetical protein